MVKGYEGAVRGVWQRNSSINELKRYPDPKHPVQSNNKSNGDFIQTAAWSEDLVDNMGNSERQVVDVPMMPAQQNHRQSQKPTA